MAQATSRIFLAAPQENILTISYPIHWGRAGMKALRASLMRMGFALVFFVAGLAGARAQALHLTVFSGTAQPCLQGNIPCTTGRAWVELTTWRLQVKPRELRICLLRRGLIDPVPPGKTSSSALVTATG